MSKTNLLIMLCVLLSLFYWYASSEASVLKSYVDPKLLDALLVFQGETFFKGYVTSVVAAIFIHADLTHLIGNMIFLFVFGNSLEKELGAKRVVAAFLTGGALSFMAGIIFYGMKTMMLGASAAIFTLAAITMLTKPLKFSWLFFMPLGLVAIIYFLYNVVAVLYAAGGSVGYEAHIFGFLVGFPMGVRWSRGLWKRNLLIAVALLIVYFAVSSFLSAGLLQLGF
ncbi:MAG TPA: rhomboid family intramembrane serine protease [Candidatus Bathyarchaeota archaeon]|nr:rhomboid family intramembrane serine protease [Candidatus Bathyarchaeota archaeon]